jgi:hypothetical protein
MSLLIRYSDPRGIEEPAALVSLSSNIPWGDVTLTNSAHLGDVANSTQIVEDIPGLLNLVGLRAMEYRETSAPSNNQIIGRFVIQDKDVSRDESRGAVTGVARVWSLDMSDYNWHLGKRVLVDQDSDRPAESIGDRLRWLINRAAHININDYGNVFYPTRELEPNDYRLQTPMEVLNDLVIEDNFNFWIDYTEAHGRPELFFIRPGSEDYGSEIAVSNDWGVLVSYPEDQVFAPSKDAKLTRSPSRIAFGAAVSHPKGFEYRRKDSTGEQYAKLDQVAPMDNVKSAARAGRLAEKFVNDHDEETDTITWELELPAEQVNDLRHGQWCRVLFTHLPGYEDWVGVRVIERTVQQTEVSGNRGYRVAYTAVRGTGDIESPGAPPLEPWDEDAIAVLLVYSGTNGAPSRKADHTGDAPPSGHPSLASEGPLTPVAGESATIISTRAMTVRVSGDAWANTVIAGPATATLTMRLLKNGVEIATEVISRFEGGAASWVEQCVFDWPGIEVEAGDVLQLEGVPSNFAIGGWGGFGADHWRGHMIVGRGTHTIPDGHFVGSWTGP